MQWPSLCCGDALLVPIMPSAPVVFPILVAEDDPNDFILLQEGLRAAGSDRPIQSFGNGAEVIQYLRNLCGGAEGGSRVPPSLLFLDLDLPQVDGAGVLAWAKRQKALAAMRIVILSGSGDSQDMQRAAAIGADRLLVKPASPASLREELARLDAR